MDIPSNLKYTNEHEWIKVENDIATVGITDFAQSELGDIVFLELPNVGDVFDKNDVFGTVEAVKTLADLYLPVSGKIVEINTSLEDVPECINEDPYNEGWIVKIQLKDSKEVESLLSYTDYKKLIG
tara:strand:+ start:182 stop:559 length:378 start_codon:yes stop_codon:yes gene_type:complete